MTVSYIHLVTEFPTIGGDPLDNSHITTNWIGFSGTNHDAALDAIDGMNAFLQGPLHSGQVKKVGEYLGAQLSRVGAAVTHKAYDVTGHLNGSPAGSYIDLGFSTLPASLDGTPMPEGIAIAVSFHSAYGTDVEFGSGTRPRARDRGRFFLGPIALAAASHDATTHRSFVNTTCLNDLSYAGLDMKTFIGSRAGTNWAVWSRAKAAMMPVAAGWIDDRFDYQRRREDQSPTRALF